MDAERELVAGRSARQASKASASRAPASGLRDDGQYSSRPNASSRGLAEVIPAVSSRGSTQPFFEALHPTSRLAGNMTVPSVQSYRRGSAALVDTAGHSFHKATLEELRALLRNGSRGDVLQVSKLGLGNDAALLLNEAGEPLLADYPPTMGTAAPEDGSWRSTVQQTMMALGGGSGASLGATGSPAMDRDLVRRMRLQDDAAMLLLFSVYFMTLFFSASLAYRQSHNHSRVTYYADPRYHNEVMETHDCEAFLGAFNRCPKHAYLRVTGLSRVDDDSPGGIEWRNGFYRIDFTFALDLSPWIVPEGSASLSAALGQRPAPLAATATASAEVAGARPATGFYRRESASAEAGAPAPAAVEAEEILEDGVVAEDLAKLRDFLAYNRNDLATVEVTKKLAWKDWEELATNIKHRIHQCGYDGEIAIERTSMDLLKVYKNEQWANFMHSKALKVIVALSILGWIIYAPYVWLRCTALEVRARHRVDITIDEYWPLIADNLSANGFAWHHEEDEAVLSDSSDSSVPDVVGGFGRGAGSDQGSAS